jgi:hypothetical protein
VKKSTLPTTGSCSFAALRRSSLQGKERKGREGKGREGKEQGKERKGFREGSGKKWKGIR